MTTWRLRLRPRSPWVTPWRADSLFGALCWRWLELFPETFPAILDGFSKEAPPPFIVSDAYPGDLMPLPLHLGAIANEFQVKKKLKRPLYISHSGFRNLMKGDMSAPVEVVENPVRVSGLIRTAIDRDLGSAAEGRLFETEIRHLTHEFDFLSVYIRADEHLEKVLACFHALALSGFGKKSSTGLGSFQIVEPPECCEWLDSFQEANAFVSLSHFVPAPDDPIDGRWNTHITYPKFHANSVSNIFKETILMLMPGSVFHTTEGHPRHWYGRMIPVPRPEMPQALHYGISFSAPIIWPDVCV